MSDALLTPTARDRLATTCRTTAGDSLRSVTYFSRTDYTQVYLRGDLEQDADLENFVGAEWQDFNVTQDAYQGSELGAYRYTIRVFENGFLVRVTTEDHGVFMTTDGITLRDFDALVSAVVAVLDDWEIDE
ncbi:MAG: DUF7522 family protein [Halobacteriota archaeon]